MIMISALLARKVFGSYIVLVSGLFILPCIADATTETFNYTGNIQTWTVPANVYSVIISAVGAAGGSTQTVNHGAYAGAATGTLSVNQGNIYYIYVPALPTSSKGTWPGGGDSGNASGLSNQGGGGFTAVALSSAINQNNIVLLAAGGGAANTAGLNRSFGDGGGSIGGRGRQGNNTCTPGEGGTQSAGGAAGDGCSGGTNGQAGSALQGGNGPNGISNDGPGGGGGYYGGGSGGSSNDAGQAAAGGGGSSFVSSTLTSTSVASTTNTGYGFVTLNYTTGMVETPTMTDPKQYKADGTTPLGEGSSTAETTVYFKAYLNSSSSNQLKLQVELSTSTSFTNVITATSSAVSRENYATTSTSNLTDGAYYWRARAIDAVTNATSSWQQFGIVDRVDLAVRTRQYVEIPNVVALYHLENTSDSSGNGYDLTNNNSAAFNDGWFGKAANGGSNNTSTYLSVANNLGINGGNISISAWFKMTGTFGENTQQWVAGHSGSASPNIIEAIGTWNDGGTEKAAAYRARNAIQGYYVTHNTPVDDGNWHHIVSTYDGSTMTLWFDGVERANTASTGAGYGGNPDRFWILNFQDTDFFKGMVDEVAVLDRVLTDTEITNLWNDGAGVETCVTSGCGSMTELSGTISSNTTWALADSPFVVTSTVTINSGVTVAVENGVLIKFKDDTDLVVNGTLDVRGTTSSLVYFTSFHDDSVGGDNNNDGTSTSPAAGDWGSINIESGVSTTLSGAVVRYGGSGASENIKNNGGMLNMSYADVSYSDHYGLRTNSGTTTITETQVHNNIDGISVASGTITVASSSIFNNTTYGAIQSYAPTSTMTGNFWGGWNAPNASATGPYHPLSNPGGFDGTSVSDYINYSPHVISYLYDPANMAYPTSTAVPSAVNFDVENSKVIRFGGSTASSSVWYEAIDMWANATSGLVNFIDASSSPSSTWDLYVEDVNDPDLGFLGQWSHVSGTNSGRIQLNYHLSKFGGLSHDEKKYTIMHELGHALGLAHSPVAGNFMKSPGELYNPLVLGPQDYQDYNFRWGYWWAELWNEMLK